MFLFIVFVILLILLIISLIAQKKERDEIREREALRARSPKTESFYNWVVDTEHIEEFEKAYREDYQENPEYNCSAKELREYNMGEKVYKYYPVELPFKMENKDVYSYTKPEQWVKIGRLKRNADINGDLRLYLFPNIYKKVRETEIVRESRTPYFGVEVTKTIEE